MSCPAFRFGEPPRPNEPLEKLPFAKNLTFVATAFKAIEKRR
jgi:hypothetical protein